MGRGVGSKGKKDPNAAPDWLRPQDEGNAGTQRVVEDAPKRRKGGDDDEIDVPKGKKGIQWKPLAFLFLMILPGLLPVIIQLTDGLQRMGWKLPSTFSLSGSPYRLCLQEFYADWAPEKLGTLDDTLSKYEGRERQLFGALKKKYGKPVNAAKCTPKKE